MTSGVCQGRLSRFRNVQTVNPCRRLQLDGDVFNDEINTLSTIVHRDRPLAIESDAAGIQFQTESWLMDCFQKAGSRVRCTSIAAPIV